MYIHMYVRMYVSAHTCILLAVLILFGLFNISSTDILLSLVRGPLHVNLCVLMFTIGCTVLIWAAV